MSNTNEKKLHLKSFFFRSYTAIIKLCRLVSGIKKENVGRIKLWGVVEGIKKKKPETFANYLLEEEK